MSLPTNKTVLVTGCSANSCGDHLAREFHRRGHHVIATARSIDRLAHLRHLGITTLELDITSTASIQALAAQITHLDMLFNNAGATLVQPLTDTTVPEFVDQFRVNVFGPFELTKALLPLLIRSKGTVVNHTSQSAHVMSIFSGAYGASKAALASLTNTLRFEMHPFDVRVVEVVTGVTESNITVGSLQQSCLRPGSLYMPVREELEPVIRGKDIEGKAMKGEVWAKQVVDDLLGREGLQWIWKGYMANVMYWMWWINCHWKGALDGVLRGALKLELLKKRLQEQKKDKRG